MKLFLCACAPLLVKVTFRSAAVSKRSLYSCLHADHLCTVRQSRITVRHSGCNVFADERMHVIRS